MRRLLCFLFHYPNFYFRLYQDSSRYWWCYRCDKNRELGPRD